MKSVIQTKVYCGEGGFDSSIIEIGTVVTVRDDVSIEELIDAHLENFDRDYLIKRYKEVMGKP